MVHQHRDIVLRIITLMHDNESPSSPEREPLESGGVMSWAKEWVRISIWIRITIVIIQGYDDDFDDTHTHTHKCLDISVFKDVYSPNLSKNCLEWKDLLYKGKLPNNWLETDVDYFISSLSHHESEIS